MLILIYRAGDPKPLGQYAVGDIAPDRLSRYVLALGSPDPRRFHPGMGTLYQTRLAELASVATARFLPPA